MPTEVFDFEGARAQAMSGRLEFPEGEIRAVALFAHCFTCTKNITSAVRISRGLARAGIATLRFDFSGLGQSEGEAASGFSSDVEDLLCAAAALKKANLPPQVLIGHSLGGAAVLAAAGRVKSARAVVTLNTPFVLAHVVRQFDAFLETILKKGEARVNLSGRPFTITRKFIKDVSAQAQGQRIKALKRSLLVMHCPTDSVVGIENAARIFQAAKHPKSFISLPKTDHLLRDEASCDYAAQMIAAWAAPFLEGPQGR